MRLLNEPVVHSAPGWKLRGIAEFLFSEKAYSDVFAPIFAELDEEHTRALAQGRDQKARVAIVRAYWSFWVAFIARLPISIIRLIYEIWKSTKK